MTIPFATASALTQLKGVQHGFFGRQGGMSTGKFDSLNCSPFSGDHHEHIQKNRALVAETLGAQILITNKQVHGNKIRKVDSATDSSEIHEADGLVTNCGAIALAALGADCAPVLFADSSAGVIGAAHAGWQGALFGVTDSLINVMCTAGASVDSLVVAIGPAIQKQSYEVGEQFREKLLDQSPVDAGACFHRHAVTDNVHFDLPGYIKLRLKSAGITRILQLNDDTYEKEEQYFSFRRACHRQEEGYGRQVGVICLDSQY